MIRSEDKITDLKVGEVFTKDKSDKLMVYLKWFVKGIEEKVEEALEKEFNDIEKSIPNGKYREGYMMGYLDAKETVKDILEIDKIINEDKCSNCGQPLSGKVKVGCPSTDPKKQNMCLECVDKLIEEQNIVGWKEKHK